MILDGKSIAEELYARLEEDFKRFGRAVRLGILVGEADAATLSFVAIKTKAAARLGVELVREELSGDATTASAVAAVKKLAEDTHGVIVQLPLPRGIDVEEVLRAIPREKDVDAVNPAIVDGERAVIAPVAGAVGELLHRARVSPAGKSVVVVGQGKLVGKPVAHYFFAREAFVRTLEAGDSLEPLRSADIIVLGAGSPGLVRPEHIKDGVVLIDAGTSEAAGKLAGDADPACAAKASVFTPVPGGVGPVAVSMIFKNLLELARARKEI